ncbi:hypothetical protein D3273_09015 [Lichenibacterium minor]|uniref:Uncharacterized protein n=1 Tax=Lichenibacterium minor TaxID=2316528 RepID=A0A4Q2U734_9HYPH|nr:hypothetical protein [Lichenibacterium minor]RYC32172.1 hypothetical protein D3273_09015 [Lichenibacterium minor]
MISALPIGRPHIERPDPMQGCARRQLFPRLGTGLLGRLRTSRVFVIQHEECMISAPDLICVLLLAAIAATLALCVIHRPMP